MNLLTPIADAVVTAIAAKTDWTWPETNGVITATRQNVPRLKREELESLRVTVVPRSRVTELITRGKRRHLVTVFVVIQRALASGEEEETDPLVLLGEELVDYFHGRTLAALYRCAEARYGEDDESKMWDVDEITGAARFLGVVVLGFEIFTAWGQAA